ncbi:MAG: ABC transporter ATP-binding protein [Pseudonocardia sp.]|nr:ABC transporter ATP-binding protein [Pseudonocardia sp.]
MSEITNTATEPLLETRDLAAGYNGVPAIRGLTLSVGPGEVVALLGPNGAGKTTSLLAMVGLVPPLAGEVRVLGEPLGKRKPHQVARAGVLLVPDDRGIFYGLTVREHLRLAGKKNDAQREVEVLDKFPVLRNLDSRRAGLMSGGEQQMLAIAKALLARPKVLIIDEMSLGLAPKIVQEMLPAIRELAKEDGIGVVLVEQHIELALGIADRGVILNHGQVVLTGAASDLLRDRHLVEAAYFGAEEFAADDEDKTLAG